MKPLFVALTSLIATSHSYAQNYYDCGWELLSFSIPFRSSPVSFGSGSNATISGGIITDTPGERSADALPNRGLFGKGWPPGTTIDPTCYVEFTVNHVGELPSFIQYVQIPLFRESTDDMGRGEPGPRKWSLRWNRDNYSTDLDQIDISTNNDRSQATFRVEL